jgi:ribosomal protein S16
VSDWLVPISRHVRFAQTSGRTVEPHYNALRDAALGGRLARVDCEVRGPLVNLRSGDTVWCCTTELEAGVFAVGRAKAPTKDKRPIVTVNFDKTRTRVLAADPLPAVTIRRWVPELRQGAVSLDLRPRALAVLDAWQRERGERDTELLAPVGATPWRAAATKGTKGAQPAQHDIVAPIARLLRSQDFAVGLESRVRGEPRLIARRARDVVVVDVCRARGGGRTEALGAIGPLLMAQWRLEREVFDDARLQATLWLAFSARPHDEVTSFLEDSGVLVSCLLRTGVVELTDRSKQRWYQTLGLR